VAHQTDKNNKSNTLSTYLFELFVFGCLGALSLNAAHASAPKTKVTPAQYFANLKADAPAPGALAAQSPLATSVSKSGRSPAEVAAADESTMTPQLIALRDSVLKANTPEQIDELLNKLDSEYESYPSSFKFVAAQFLVLKPMRGFFWRILPLVEKNTMLHSMILSFAKTAAAQIKVYYPNGQWEAGWAYLSEPYVKNGKVIGQIATEEALQAFLANTVYRNLRKATERLEALDLTQSMTWDNKIFYGSASYEDKIDRYRLVGEVERLMTISSFHSNLAQLAFQRAYSLQGVVDLYADLGKLYGFDGIFTGNVSGAPASERTAVVRAAKFASLGTLLPDGDSFTKLSLQHLQKSAYYASEAWDALQSRPVSETYVINSGPYLAAPRIQKIRISNLKAMLEGPAQIRSAATGEIAEVNLTAFYETPPKDLKDLLATGFDGGSKWAVKDLTLGDGKSTQVKFRNFYEGRPDQWNVSALQPYFPKVSSSDDVRRTARILDEAYGGSEAALPLAFIVR